MMKIISLLTNLKYRFKKLYIKYFNKKSNLFYKKFYFFVIF